MKSKIIISGLVTMLCVFSSAALRAGEDAGPDVIVAPPPQPLATFDLPAFSGPTADEEPHFFKLTIALAYHADPGLKKELAAQENRIRHIVNIMLHDKKYEDLDTVSGKIDLVEEIKAQVNMSLESGKISEVYIKEFVLKQVNTGNAVDTFWLDGDLRISAVEQVEVMKNVYDEKHPFEKTYYAILKNIMIQDRNDNYTVRAKTGTVARMNPNIGWYVGYVETADDVWFFACNIEMTGPGQAGFRKEMVYTALKDLKIINP